MAGSVEHGPIGVSGEVENLDDGTMIRALSPWPGPVGSELASREASPRTRSLPLIPPKSARRGAVVARLQALRQGSRGAEVQKLQRQLNIRLIPSPELAIDGIFGPLTLQAVLQYQKDTSIAADGVVGKETWYHLLKGDKAAAIQATIRSPQHGTSVSNVKANSQTATRTLRAPGSPIPAAGIWELPLADKFAEALRRTARKLPDSMRHEFEVLLSPTSLGIIAGTLVVWAGSHAFGVGEILDVGLLIGGAFLVGTAFLDVAGELGDFLVVTSTAAEEDDLDQAASCLARTIAIIGVAAFVALLAKLARRRSGNKSVVSEAAAQPEPERSTARSKPSHATATVTEPSPRKAAKLPPKRTANLRSDLGERWFKPDGELDWPPHAGFSGEPKPTTLPVGTKVDRYGSSGGSFLSPEGTPYGERSLPYDPSKIKYHAYEVVKPLDVNSGSIAPHFDQPGNGLQYETAVSVRQLIDEGYLKEISK